MSSIPPAHRRGDLVHCNHYQQLSISQMDTPQLAQKKTTISFIGAGNMARSLIVGLLQEDNDLQLRVADPDENQLDSIRKHWSSVETTTSNVEAIIDADVVILAVKPQIMQQVVSELTEVFQQYRPMVISVAAGIQEASLQQWLGGDLAIVRCMPNTPALVQAGATGLFANEQTSAEQRSLAESILRAVGVTLWVDTEEMIDSVTAVSGSGPAYFFRVMEAMESAAVELGLSAQDAHLMVVQTALGAAKLALESDDSPAELRQKVTSKGGTTAAALDQLNAGDIDALFEKAMQAAAQRSRELAAENK